MKLGRSPRHSSFYESFSDLMFGTMAIFVLLVIILATQVRPDGVPSQVHQEALDEVARARAITEALQKQVAELEKQGEPKPLELVVAIDGSGSMGAALKTLQFAIGTIGETMPMIASSVHVGIVIYRDAASTAVFPVTKIEREEVDGGRSLALLNQFAQTMVPQPARADLAHAVRSATAMFGPPSGGEPRKRTLMVAGDVGPYEIGDFMNEAGESEIHRVLTEWKRNNSEASVIAVYTGSDQSDEWIVGHRERTLKLFREMAVIGGDASNFSPHDRKLFPLLLKGILG
ncbi:vWA domain-containing protein [Hydrogenophaga laconesensis]|uniref:VWFA domain-containing protein n=1 Tax=Hydrogenophaga laconesensis TaxID=1805971 RepID=A0ABU1V9E5_9BURK|nr:vWA domain-containing protein [Hydrogenophaga laconesensis]MDR7093838.1 hypothetical protein [Hydrogenophaga laconesensis]